MEVLFVVSGLSACEFAKDGTDYLVRALFVCEFKGIFTGGDFLVVLIFTIEVDFLFGSSVNDQCLLGQLILGHFDVLLRGGRRYLVDELKVQHKKQVVIERQGAYDALRLLQLPVALLEHDCAGTS